MNELLELVEGLERINILCDNVMTKLNGNDSEVKRIPVILISERGHSCKYPQNCRLNTNLNPYYCMTVNNND